MNNIKHLNKLLNNSIDELMANYKNFLTSDCNYFSRNRKINLKTLIESILFMGSSSLKNELFDLFKFNDLPSTSAFVQQRNKLHYTAFQFLFNTFTKKIVSSYSKLFNGFRLIAIDGSSVPISYDPNDKETYINQIDKYGNECKGHNAIHVTAMYDLLEHIYIDVVLQGEANMNENGAFNELVDRYNSKDRCIIIGDRGFESLNSFVHVLNSGNKYLIRVKDINSKTSVSKSFELPREGAFDVDVKKTFTRKQTKEIKNNPRKYKFMPKNQRFDFFDDSKFYEFECRVVRFKISEDTYETIFTNLSRDEFPSEIIKELYNMRWGIETSFRELKYAVGLNAFHAKNRNSIYQEIYARLVFYNLSEKIIRNIKPRKAKKQRKHTYAINSTFAFHKIRLYFKIKRGGKKPPDIESIIANEILPIRPGRSDRRKVRKQASVYFIYRFQ